MPDLHNSHALTHLIMTYGYWAILSGVAVDSFGVPLPGEAMLLTASVYAGATHQLLLPLVILCAGAGGVIGDNLSYCLGRRGGTRLLQRFGPLVHLNRRRQLLAQYLYRRYAASVVVIGRFIPIIHIATAVLAGVNAMSWRRFALSNGLGCLLRASLMGLAGFSLGQLAVDLDHAVLAFAVPGASVIAIGVLLAMCPLETRLLSLLLPRVSLPRRLATDAECLANLRPRRAFLAEDRDCFLQSLLRLMYTGRSAAKTLQQHLAGQAFEVLLHEADRCRPLALQDLGAQANALVTDGNARSCDQPPLTILLPATKRAGTARALLPLEHGVLL